MKSLTDMGVQNPHATQIMEALPLVAMVWKMTVTREIILSGFQQELYASYERPLAYWYLFEVLHQHLEAHNKLKSVIPAGKAAWVPIV